jgi:hypothetical protein
MNLLSSLHISPSERQAPHCVHTFLKGFSDLSPPSGGVPPGPWSYGRLNKEGTLSVNLLEARFLWEKVRASGSNCNVSESYKHNLSAARADKFFL